MSTILLLGNLHSVNIFDIRFATRFLQACHHWLVGIRRVWLGSPRQNRSLLNPADDYQHYFSRYIHFCDAYDPASECLIV